MLALLATGYGIGAAVAMLLQAHQMHARRRSCEVSALFLAIWVAGYGLWLAYGIDIGSSPLMLVNAMGLACATVTLGVALALRGALLRPSTWRSCALTLSAQEHR